MTTMCYTPAGMKLNLDHLSAALVFILLVVSLPAQSDSSSPLRKLIEENRRTFALFNACKPMNIWVTELSSDAEKISLQKEDIINIVESRLRSAKLFFDIGEGEPFLNATLFVSVAVVGSAFSVDVQFSKKLWDEVSEIRDGATTWQRNILGTHGTNTDFILPHVKKLTEEFITEYLRENDEAC